MRSSPKALAGAVAQRSTSRAKIQHPLVVGVDHQGQLVLDALDMAIQQRGSPKGVLVHSDQGSQYTAQAYRDKLKENNMCCSMSRKGNCHDNAVAESFFHTLKEELVRDEHFSSLQEAKQKIFSYIELHYNRQRLHSTLGYHAPLEYERMQAVAK